MALSLSAAQATICRPLARHNNQLAASPLQSVRLATSNAHLFCLHKRTSATGKYPAIISSALQNPPLKSSQNPPNILYGSTRTVTTLLAAALALSKLIAHKTLSLAVQLRQPICRSIGPAFFAAINDVPTGSLNTPFTVVAAGMAKWLDLYSGVLMVRVLLSWFPNIPWDRQPLSAIRDLCDPYLNLFRNIIPPIFDTLDVSPLLAFAVLGTLGSILNSSRQSY